MFPQAQSILYWDTDKAWNGPKGRTHKGQKRVVLVLKTWSWFYENTKNKIKRTESKRTGDEQWHGFGLNLALKVQVRPHEELGVGVKAKRLAAGLPPLPGSSASAPARLPHWGGGSHWRHAVAASAPQRARMFQGSGNSTFWITMPWEPKAAERGQKTFIFSIFQDSVSVCPAGNMISQATNTQLFLLFGRIQPSC